MWEFPHSYDPNTWMKSELWVGVAPNGQSPVTCIPMKRDAEGGEAEGRELI